MWSDALARRVPVRAQADVLLLVAVGARGEVRQRAHARVDALARLAVEARDHVGEVGARPRRGRTRSRARSRPSPRSPPRAPRRRRRAPRASGARGPAHAGTSRPASSRSTRSAIAGGARLVGDEHDRAALGGELAEQREHRGARLDVEVAGRLVGQQQRRVVDQRAGDREALLLAAGELVRERAGDVAQPEPVDQRPRPARPPPARRPRTRPASSTFASPLSSGSRWKNWNTKPMWRRRTADSARSPTPRDGARPRPRPCPPRAGRARRARAAASTCPTPSGRARRRSRPPRRRGRRRRAPGAPRGPRRRCGPARARQTSGHGLHGRGVRRRAACRVRCVQIDPDLGNTTPGRSS